MMRRAFSTAATLLALILAGSPCAAQRLITINPSAPPGQQWLPKQPDWPAPPDMESLGAIDSYVLSLTANQVDPALPAVDLAHWLASVLWPKTTGGVPELPRLETEQCHDRTSDAPALGPEWCGRTTVALSEIRNFTLVFAVAAAVPGNVDLRWILTPPSVRQIRLSERLPDGNWDSLDVPSLLDLRESLELPVERWPKVALQSAVESTHARALPGEVVTFTIRIRNAGKRDLERAEVNVQLNLHRTEEKRQYVWFPRIPAGHTANITFTATMPAGGCSVSVRAYPFEPIAPDPDPDDNYALMWIFPVTDPPDAVLPQKVSNPAGIRP